MKWALVIGYALLCAVAAYFIGAVYIAPIVARWPVFIVPWILLVMLVSGVGTAYLTAKALK